MSEYEQFLHESWVSSFQRRIGGLRATTSISELVNRVCVNNDYDYVFYDTGPNIGPLTRISHHADGLVVFSGGLQRRE